MTVVEKFQVAVPHGALALVLHVPETDRPVPLVVACHGLSASKDSDKYLRLAEVLPPAGLALGRFDFRGCGESSGVEEDTTIASRIEDVEAVLGALAGAEMAMRDVGIDIAMGSGVAAAQAHFRKTIMAKEKPPTEEERFAETHPEGVVHA